MKTQIVKFYKNNKNTASIIYRLYFKHWTEENIITEENIVTEENIKI